MLSGKELKIHRIIKDIDAIEVAEYLGVHKSYISKLERGVQNIPQHIYDKWVEFLDININ